MVDVTRRALGTNTSKVSGTTLALASILVNDGEALVVGVGYDTGQGAPVVTWGNRELSQIKLQSQSGAAVALYLLRHINNTNTRTITCTWSGAIVAKALFATAVGGVKIQDVSQSAGQVADADPATGAAVQSTQPDTIQIAAFVSQGPPADTVGTVNLGHTSGQRAGTAGAPPASNITIHETFEILTATGDVRATKTGATARNWANAILAIKQSLRFRQGITPSDLARAEEIFEADAIDWKDHAFHFNRTTDEWEVYDASTDTLVASRSNTTGAWS